MIRQVMAAPEEKFNNWTYKNWRKFIRA